MYSRVNLLFGDIVRVTPSSKGVGDMALFMVQNELDEENILTKGQTIDFPDSVVEFFQGYIGQPYGGFPEDLQKVVLKDREAITVRPVELLDPIDFDELKKKIEDTFKIEATNKDVLAYALYPKVMEEYYKAVELYGDLSVLDTPSFLYGLRIGEEIEVEIEKGKTLIIKLLSIGEAEHDGTRVIYFEFNGQPREVVIQDLTVEADGTIAVKANPNDPNQIGATMPGTVLKVVVSKGSRVKRGDHLLITEAMKMETTVQAPKDGIVKEIYAKEGDAISTGDLLLELE